MSADGVAVASEESLADPVPGRYVLRLFVVGSTPRGARTIARVRHVCEALPGDLVDLEVIDLRQRLGRALGDDVIAVPTLVRQLPLPVRRIIGEIAEDNQVRALLDLAEEPARSGT